MKYPSRHAHESLEDWEAACLRHEEHAESQRELWHEREAERIAGLETDNPDPVAVICNETGEELPLSCVEREDFELAIDSLIQKGMI